MNNEQAPVTAEEQLTLLQEKFTQTQAALAETRGRLESVERSRAIEAALVEAGAMDLEAGRILLEASMGAEGKEAKIEEAVEELGRRRPYLFHRVEARSGGAMGPRAMPSATPVQDAAEEAAATGHRRDLLRYLRLRRQRG